MKHLSQEQRYAIKAYLESGKKPIFIASQISLDVTAVSREAERNSIKRSKYNPDFVQELVGQRL